MNQKPPLTPPDPPDGIPIHLRLAPTSHQAFLDRWIIQSIQIDPHTSTRLNGENSLYQTYQDACRQREAPPLSVRYFTRRLEVLLEFHFHIATTKTRDYKGTFFLGLKLNPVFRPPKADKTALLPLQPHLQGQQDSIHSHYLHLRSTGQLEASTRQPIDSYRIKAATNRLPFR